MSVEQKFIPLSLKYRPHKFEDMVGQEVAIKTLRSSILNHTPYPSLIFYGGKGLGKTTTSRIYGMALNCEHPINGDPCGVCESCRNILNNNHPSYIELDSGNSGGIDAVRKIVDLLSFKPIGKHRVIVIDEAHQVTTQAFQALLKSVEEPPENNTFVFATTEVDKIPPTISSRSFPIPFRMPSYSQVELRLAQICAAEGIKIESPEVLQILVRRSDRSIRNSIVALDQARAISLTTDNPNFISKAILSQIGYCDPSVYTDFLTSMKTNPDHSIELLMYWAESSGVVDFVRGLEETLHNEILLRTGAIKANQSGTSTLNLSLPEIWEMTQRIWKSVELAKGDNSHLLVSLVCDIRGVSKSNSGTPDVVSTETSVSANSIRVSQEKKQEVEVKEDLSQEATVEDATNLFN